jgi:methylated-DNA-[protein]-cysteine S-methyltransferase
MQCRTALTRLDALRTGELEAPESTAVNQHLRTCRSCDESLDDVAQLARAAKALTVTPPRTCRTALRSELADRYDRLDIDAETLWVAFSDRGMRMIHRGGSATEFETQYRKRFGRDLEPGTLPDRFRRHIEDALSGRGVKNPLVDLLEVSDFEREVLNILTRIPRGEVRTYTWVARQAGRPGAVRAVGNICARNAVPFVIPCHRVVPSGGGVGQYAFGSSAKRALLEHEGVAVDELDELARRGIRFIGSRNTRIFCVPTCRDAKRIGQENRVPFHEAGEAASKGFRPCQRCRPAA